MRAAISKTTFVVACNSDPNASPHASAASVQLLPSPCTLHIASSCSKASPTRCVATSMFEVPLERPCSDSHVKGNILLELVNPFSSKHPSSQHTFLQDNQGTRHKRNGRRRSRAQRLSLFQGLSKNGDFLNVIGATGLPMARSGGLQGPGGIFMALAVTLVALLAAVKQGLSMGSSQHRDISCLLCNGSKFHRCGLCKGRGVVEWEGKLRHTDPCPRCFGSCQIKCSKCGG